MEIFRTRQGIRTRSGPSRWTLRGETEGTCREVEVSFETNGQIQIRYRKPIQFDPSGKSAVVTVPPERRDAFLAELSANMKRKGRTVTVTEIISGIAEPIKLETNIGFDALKQGLLKIAFLTAYEYLGDAFLTDPLIPEWHRAVMSESPAFAAGSRIHGAALSVDPNLVILLPELQEHEHGVAVFVLQEKGPMVVVKLFGSDLLSSFSLASEASDYGLKMGDGKIVVCDTKTRKIRTIRFQDHMETLARSENMPGTLRRMKIRP